MHGSRKDIPKSGEAGGWVSHETEWGEMLMSYDFMPAGLDGRPLFQGLPDDLCPVPHWGVVVRGRMRIQYRDREETIVGGQAFYLEPGHVPFAEEDTEVVFFSPAEEMKRVVAALEAKQAEAQGEEQRPPA